MSFDDFVFSVFVGSAIGWLISEVNRIKSRLRDLERDQ